MQRNAVGIDSQMRGAPQPAVEVIAPCVVGTNNAARKLTADGAGVFERHEFRTAVPADVIKSAQFTVIAPDHQQRLILEPYGQIITRFGQRIAATDAYPA